jgi:hypothetical protein
MRNVIEYTVSGFREEIDRKLLEALKALKSIV